MKEGIRKHLTTILVAFVTAMVASGSAAVAYSAINASKVDGYDANQLVRSAFGTGGVKNDFASTSYKKFATTSLSTAKKGLLLISGTASAEWDIDSTDDTYTDLLTRIKVDGKTVGQQGTVELRDPVYGDPNFQGNYSTNAVNQVVVKVGPGTHTIMLQGANSGSGANIYINHSSVMVLFEPFGHAGKAGVLRLLPVAAGHSSNQR